ncbi:MAG: diguanylate cyclase [Eubacteriales bacterium]
MSVPVIMIVAMIILIVAVVALIFYNMSINKKIKKFKSINQRITNLQVVQEFINTIGEDETVDQKIKKINNLLIEKYDIKYSTIVIFNGAEYEIKASNVDKKHWETLSKLNEVELFQDSISGATPKYVTVNNDSEKLPYQQTELGRAKSALFFPLYITNVYIGYWIIESGVMHDFDNVDTTILEVIKDNVISVLKSIEYQKIVEGIVREDKMTNLNSEAYMYGEGRRKLEKFPTSSLVMLKITNLEQSNKIFSRELGNLMVKEVARIIKENITPNYIFVRHMGPKFVLGFPGVDISGVPNFLKNIKTKIENLELVDPNGPTDGGKKARIRLNFVMSTYYKGTGIEEILKKEEEYLDNAKIDESNITSI